MIEIAQEVFSKKGLKLDYQLAPWSRAIEMVARGEAQGLVGASVSDSPDLAYHKEPIGKNISAFYTLTESKWIFKGISSLNSISLGVASGYSYSKDLDSYVHKHIGDFKHIQLAASEHALQENLERLLKKEIDSFIENQAVVDYYLLSHPEQKLAIRVAGYLPEAKKSDSDLFIAFSPESEHAKDYALILDEGIKELRKSGELDAIMAKYGLKDWK